MTPQKWLKNFILITGVILLVIVAAMVILDPYFHYHGPLQGLSYRLYEERYTNDGIGRHFDYDGIITGTSMTQNFKASEAEELFGGRFIKMSFSGAGYKELSDNLEAALSEHPETKRVIWAVDYNGMLRKADYKAYSEYPEYLYDSNPFNDVSYIFNKSIWVHGLLKNLTMTFKNEPTTSFDEYSSWSFHEPLTLTEFIKYRAEHVASSDSGLTEEERDMVYENIKENILRVAEEFPNTEFDIYYPPFSILYFDLTACDGKLTAQLEAEEIVTRALLTQPNIKLYSYFTELDYITDLSQYKDKEHHSPAYNSQILKWISEDYGRITKDNVDAYEEFLRNTYLNYDYDSIYEQERGFI